MKILKILNSGDTGGIYTCELQYIEEMVRRGVVVDGLIVGPGDKKEPYKQVVTNAYHLEEEYKYPEFRKLPALLFARRYSERLSGEALESIQDDYDAIIYRKQYYLHLGGILGRALNIPVYWFMPNALSAFSRMFYAHYVRKYPIIPIANSQHTLESFSPICRHYVYPGFEENKIVSHSPDLREDFKIPEEAPVYGVAARIAKEKAHDLVIRAFRKSGIPDAGGHLIIAGGPLDTPYHEKLKQLAGDLLGNRIHFAGHVKNMASFYSSIDILINGRRDAEPFGISIAEAMAFGKPVIAYHLGGPSEMITDNETGWLIDKSEPSFYIDAFNKSLEFRDRWDEMGKKASIRSEAFGCKKNVSKLLGIIGNYP